MSTRCQVRVEPWDEAKVDEGNHPNRMTLYHHCDGYPDGMLPVIESAFNEAVRPTEIALRFGQAEAKWESGRVGKVASYLCWAHPGQFEPEQGHDLHPDIEWFYRIQVRTGKWRVFVYETNKAFWKDGGATESNLELRDTQNFSFKVKAHA